MPNASHSSSRQSHQASANRRLPPRNLTAPDEDNYYHLLGVPYAADQKEIRRAYRMAMKKAHPDRALPERRAAAEELAKLLNRAYATLSDPNRRRAYDQSIKSQELQDQIMRRYVSTGVGGPINGARHDPFAQRLKRDLSAAEKMENRKADRSAMLSLLLVFVVATAVVILLVLLLALATWMFSFLA